jgi:succinyl-CoA synthetase alpha subunit
MKGRISEMAILINEDTRVIVQGATGNQGKFHMLQMLAYGTKVVGGISPGKGGIKVENIPIYDTVLAASEENKIDAACLFIPAPFAKDAAFEAIEAGIKLVVIITEHIPLNDGIDIIALARQRGAMVIGPNTFGIVSSGKCKIGIPPNNFFIPGPIGVVARSGTLTYEIVGNLTDNKLGQSTVVGLGGDRVVGLSFVDVLKKFEDDDDTKAIVLVGEIGGDQEESAASYIKQYMTKPVIAYIAGKSAPPGKRMGHAGAIIERGKGTYEGKIKALQMAGVSVADLPFEVPGLIRKVL